MRGNIPELLVTVGVVKVSAPDAFTRRVLTATSGLYDVSDRGRVIEVGE